MKELKTLLFIILIINPLTLVSQSIENFVLNSDNPKLEGQFYVGNYSSNSIEEAKYKFLKWLTYYNVGEDIYIDEIEDGRIVFTRIFPQGINMRILKGAQFDLLGNVDLAVRFVVEFKDSRYRILIDRLGYFENEFDSASYFTASGKFKEYNIIFSEKDISREYTSYSNPQNLPLEYRNPEEIKKTEKKKLDDLIVLLNSFLDKTSEFENEFYPDTEIVDEFKVNEVNSFPGQSIRTDYESLDNQDFILKVTNWFDNNKEELGLRKLYVHNDKIFMVGKRYFNSSSGLLATMEAMTGVSFGDVQYYYIEVNLNNNSFDFGINKILRASYTNECGTGLDKTIIKQGGYELIVDKKIYIPTELNTATLGGIKEFEVCPAILLYNEVTNYSDLFRKNGKPRKARTKASNDELAYYNSIYQNFKRNFTSETEDDW